MTKKYEEKLLRSYPYSYPQIIALPHLSVSSPQRIYYFSTVCRKSSMISRIRLCITLWRSVDNSKSILLIDFILISIHNTNIYNHLM